MSAARWAVAGGVVGTLLGVLLFAPAAWLANGLVSATDGRLMLADARGTVWRGSGVLVLTGGEGSRDASALPGRLAWRIGYKGGHFTLRLNQACCINGTLNAEIEPGFGRWAVTLPAAPGALGQWPAAWLAGLGTPWNTLQLTGSFTLASQGLKVESAQGRVRVEGAAVMELNQVASRLSTLAPLGSYRLNVAGGDITRFTLATTSGPLQLSGSGQWAAAKLRFNGEARAAEGSEAALSNLLNIIGRRQGARAIIAIG